MNQKHHQWTLCWTFNQLALHVGLLCSLGLSAVAHTSGEGITDATWIGAGEAESALPARDGEESHGGLQQAQPPPPPRPRPLPDLGALPHVFVSFGNAAYFDLAHNWARSVQALGVPYILAGKGSPAAAQHRRAGACSPHTCTASC